MHTYILRYHIYIYTYTQYHDTGMNHNLCNWWHNWWHIWWHIWWNLEMVAWIVFWSYSEQFLWEPGGWCGYCVMGMYPLKHRRFKTTGKWWFCGDSMVVQWWFNDGFMGFYGSYPLAMTYIAIELNMVAFFSWLLFCFSACLFPWFPALLLICFSVFLFLCFFASLCFWFFKPLETLQLIPKPAVS